MKAAGAALVGGAAVMGLAGCDAPGTDSGENAETGTDTQGGSPDGGDDVVSRDDLNVIMGAEFSTLDPQQLSSSADICFCTNIFDSLVDLEEDGTIVPRLATEWEISDDNLTYTFHLREGVKFHNGNDLTAEDVKLSVERFRDETCMQFASFAVDSSEVIDDYTVTIKLKYPYGNFLTLLWYCAIIDADHFNSTELEEFGRNPMGSGPYKFVEWVNGQHVTIEANEDYWDGAPSIKKVTVSFITDVNTALISLETGESDFAYGTAVTPVTFNTAQTEDADTLATSTTGSNNFYFVNFNSDRVEEPVRQALSYAVDRDTINTMVNEGMGTPGNLPLLEGQEGYTTDLATYPYDPDKAKELLSAAGVDGLELSYYYRASDNYQKIGEVLQANFDAVGVTLNLEPVESGTWWSTFMDEDYDLSAGGYPMEIFDTDTAYFDMYHSTGTFNVSHIHDEQLDALLDEARTEPDSAKRDEIYVEVNQMLADAAYYVPLYFTPALVIYNKDLKGVEATRNERYQFKKYSW